MRSRFAYLGDTVVEFIIDGDSVTMNVLPAETAPAEPIVSDVDVQQPEQVPVDAPLAAPLELAVAPPPRLAPAASSGFKAGLASFGGMIAAALLYVQENFGSVTDISLKNVILVFVGAVISGLLYFFYRWYKPHTS
jgi:hypothetical protein